MRNAIHRQHTEPAPSLHEQTVSRVAAPSNRVTVKDLYANDNASLVAAVRVYKPNTAVPTNQDHIARIELTVNGAYTERCGNLDRAGTPGAALYRPPELPVTGQVSPRGLTEFVIALTRRPDRYPRDPESHPLLTPLAASAFREFIDRDRSSLLAIESIIAELAAVLANAKRRRDTTPTWLPRVLDKLQSTPDRAPTLDDLAAVAQIHPTHLVRAFRMHTRCTPGQYHRLVRLERASRALADSDTPIAEIAKTAGFVDQSHFGRHFRRAYTFSPAAYRRTLRQTRFANN